MAVDSSDPNDDLIRRAHEGDTAAREQLLGLHRVGLCKMVTVRMDPRLRDRLDPSDVVQEALAEAWLRLPDWLDQRPMPLLPWLRRLTLDRLIELYRHHVTAQRRSVSREAEAVVDPDNSALRALADRLAANGPTPSEILRHEELREQIRTALLQLNEPDRELLVLRYVEQLPMAEVSALLGVTEGAAKVRAFRALQRLRALLESPADDPS